MKPVSVILIFPVTVMIGNSWREIFLRRSYPFSLDFKDSHDQAECHGNDVVGVCRITR